MTASKRRFAISALAAAGTALLAPGRVRADPPLVLADRGRSDYRLVLPQDALPSERHAAEEFRKFFKEISGAELPIGVETDPAGTHEIALNARGRIAGTDPELAQAAPGRDGFVIRAKGNHLLIVGDRPRGTLNAVYALLEEQLGCRWFTREISRIPKRERVELGPLGLAVTPPFEYREDYYTEVFDGDWAARHRLNGNHMRLTEAHGGGIHYQPFCHSFDAILSPRDHFAAHPEYFSEVGGRRRQDYAQLCLSNPDVLRLTIDRVKQWIREHSEAKIISVTQNDNGLYCRCAACRAVDEREGSPSGSMIAFVNQVADAIEKDHPEIAIDTFAYQYTRKPPKTLRPRKNVIVRLCSIECCFAHPLATCPQNASFREDIVNWSKICDRLYVWDYVTDFAHYLLPFPNFDALGPNLEFYAAHGVKGIFEEGNYSGGGGGELSELRAYVLAKVLWNPKTDVKQLIEEFTDAVYGEAGPQVREYLELLQDRVRVQGPHVTIWAKPDAPYLGGDFLDRAEAIFDAGAKAVKDPAALARLRKARVPLDYLRLVRTAPGSPDRAKRLEAFGAACAEFGITNESEGQSVEGFKSQTAK